MKAYIIIILAVAIFAFCQSHSTDTDKTVLAVESPSFFPDQPSPLLKAKENLKKREYYDFLSHLYRHDKTKSDLFDSNKVPSSSGVERRKKRTIIFRPLFVYRQQQIKRRKTKRQ